MDIMETDNGTPVENLSVTEPSNPSDLTNQISALQRKNSELIGERRKDRERLEQLQQQLEEIQDSQRQQNQQKLAESGEYKKLWEDAQETIRNLQAQLSEKDQAIESTRKQYQAQTLKTAAIAALSQAGALAPDQLHSLIQQDLTEKDGKPVAIRGGVELSIEDYISELKKPASGWEHHFSASGRSGMGTLPGRSAAPGASSDNPFKAGPSFNITKQMILFAQNPELAKAYQQEALNS